MSCECGDMNVSSPTFSESNFHRGWTVHSIDVGNGRNVTPMQAWGNWRQIIGACGSFALSFEQDRLAALSGLASVFEEQRLGLGTYIAGI